MIPILKKFIHDLLYSPERATLWFRGIATWLATAAGLVVAYPPETIANWHFKDWVLRFVIAAIGGLAVMAKAGEKNQAAPSAPPAP
jgi:hypothetical protein